MSWSVVGDKLKFQLSWHGFSDPHSNISTYFVSLSQNFSKTFNTEGNLQLSHDYSSFIQTASIMVNYIDIPELVYLSIRAKNNVGLITNPRKMAIYLQNNGSVEIQNHSCEVHYCTNQCTCGVLNEVCQSDPKICHNINATDSLEAFLGLNPISQMFSSSSACIPGYWTNNVSKQDILKYEWLVTPVSVNDIPDYKFIDNEHGESAITCDATDALDGSYVIHVREWLDYDQYNHVKSQPVMIDHTPPYVAYGKSVIDTNENFTSIRLFTEDINGIYSTWENVFYDHESGMAKYIIAIGMTPGGNEVLGPLDVGLDVNFSDYSLLMSPGSHYYTTVYAYNNVGMVISSTSKGFVVDKRAPFGGNVYSGAQYMNQQFHTGNIMQFSWLGFTDKETFITKYLYTVSNGESCPLDNYEEETLNNNIQLHGYFEHGGTYTACVKAVDAAGHVSEAVQSNIVTFDNTPPRVLVCSKETKTIFMKQMECTISNVHNSSINGILTNTACFIPEKIHLIKNKLYHVKIITNTFIGGNTKIEIFDTAEWLCLHKANSTHYEHSSYFIQSLWFENTVKLYTHSSIIDFPVVVINECEERVDVMASDWSPVRQCGLWGFHVNIPTLDIESGISKMQFGFGTNAGGIQIVPIQNIGSGVSYSSAVQLYHHMNIHTMLRVQNQAGLQSKFTFKTTTIDTTPPLIENINLNILYKDVVHLSASWVSYDSDSDVINCLWKIASSQRIIMDWTFTDALNYSISTLPNLPHGTMIFTKLKCFNKLNMFHEAEAEPVQIVIDPPESLNAMIHLYPHQNTVYNPTQGVQMKGEAFEFSYQGFDDETGISFYEYSIYQTGTRHWRNASIMDHVVLGDLHVSDGTCEVGVRAVNKQNHTSKMMHRSLRISKFIPQLTGQDVVDMLHNHMLILDWSNVFTKPARSLLRYDLYVGSNEGASDVFKVVDVYEDNVTIDLKRLQQLTMFYVYIVAVAPSGSFVDYRYLLNYNSQ